MKIDPATLLTIPLTRVAPQAQLPFPIYVYLPLNKRYILVRGVADSLGERMHATLVRRGTQNLFTTPNFRKEVDDFLGLSAAQGAAAADDTVTKISGDRASAETITEIPAELTPEVSAEQKIAAEKQMEAEVAAEIAALSKEAVQVKEVLENPDLSEAEKSNELAEISRALLKTISQITSTDEDDRADGISKCREITDQILSIAAKNSNIYDEILVLRNSQEDIEHSVIVGTIATMFALAIGISNDEVLGDLVMAALFHDIGLVKVNPEVLGKPEPSWAAQEHQEYERHVQHSLDMLKESGNEFPQRVLRYIREHHENYDGSGFPNKLVGAKIDEISQILHLANLFDRLCTGKQTGKEISPAAAFEHIKKNADNTKAVQEIRPELVQRVFQFMDQEKQMANELRATAEEASKAAIDEINNRN